ASDAVLRGADRAGCCVILSGGLSSLAETLTALSVTAFACAAEPNYSPSVAAFTDAWQSPDGRKAVLAHVTLLHCTSEYPTPPADVNLRAMDALREATGLRVGLSDHTDGITIAIAAAARGAVVVEKHFTLDRAM